MQNTMKATLVVNGKEFPIEINDPELIKLISTPKKTGCGRVEKDDNYFYIDDFGAVVKSIEELSNIDHIRYEVANYYSDRNIAENNARADVLFHKLRRFAVEHREKKIDWKDDSDKYCIYYNNNDNIIRVDWYEAYQHFGRIYFDSKATAELAIEEFKDELIWYFTVYKDSL